MHNKKHILNILEQEPKERLEMGTGTADKGGEKHKIRNPALSNNDNVL